MITNSVHNRLQEAKTHLEGAGRDYFDPNAFLRHVHACLIVMRTITFLVQAQKKNIAEFEDWYSQWQNRMKDDKILDWAKNERNKIEKQGDIQKFSQCRGEIIAGYLRGPKTDWVSHSLFQYPFNLLLSIPKKLLTQHVTDHGILIVERRWVANSLPEVEITEALAHVYNFLCDLVNDLSEKLAEHERAVTVDIDAYSRRAALRRAVYISIRDGSVIGFRPDFLSANPANFSKTKKRYKRVDLNAIREAKSLRDRCEAHFQQAKEVLRKDGYHVPIVLMYRDGAMLPPISMELPERSSKYLLSREMALVANDWDADTVIFINEAWGCKVADLPDSGFAAESASRFEFLNLIGINKNGEGFQIYSKFVRKSINKIR